MILTSFSSRMSRGNSRLRDVKALAAEVFNQFILRFDLMLGNNLNYLLQTVLFFM